MLIVDDEELVLDSLSALLQTAGIRNVVACRDSRAAVGMLIRQSCSVVLLDLRMPGITGQELLPALLAESPETPVIVLTGLDEVDVAVQCMKTGAFDFIQKPVESVRLVTSVRNAIERCDAREENERLRASIFDAAVRSPEAFAGFVTRSPAMGAIFRYVEAIAPTSLPVLITGETGVGKELLARAIHTLSGREGAFVAVNVAGLDDTLFSDALFGHRRGSFTGASEAREGMVAAATRGTLFLDEIGDIHPESQVKLLRLLQEKVYYPLGSDQPVTTDSRFVFATNQALDEAASRGTVSEGPVLPSEGAPHPYPALAGAARRHFPPDRPFSRAGGQGDRQGAAAASARAVHAAGSTAVPGKRARAGGTALRCRRATRVRHPFPETPPPGARSR